MKKFLLPLFLILSGFVYGQLNNSWIDYNKTYYKFKVSKTGLCRIGQSTLSSLGLGTTPCEQFQLWRNGQEVPLYTTIPTGVMSASDYIEFWGKSNDGVPDLPLYRDPNGQLSDSFSLETDTAAFFMTVNTAGNNLRYNNAVNNVAGNTLTADAYYMRKLARAYKEQYNRGYAVVVGEYVYSSSYDLGEGWTSYDTQPGFDLTNEFDGLNLYAAGPPNSLSFSINAFGNALNGRNLQVKLFNNMIIDTPMNYFTVMKIQKNNLPLSLLQNPGYVPIYMNGNSTIPTDRIVVGQLSITYPATFNFNNEKSFYFELAPSAVGNYLVIDNFNFAGVPPVLLSLNDGKRYIGDISIPGKVRFALPASNDPVRKFNLISEDAGNINNITSIVTRNFINYADVTNQGDYLIISHPSLYNDGNGVNYVDQYKTYRTSANGGGFNTKVVSIDELTDQFAFGIVKHPAAVRDFIRFADLHFTVKPKYVFLLGRGISSIEYRQNDADPIVNKLDLIPSFGWPASDQLLACQPGTTVPIVPIARLSAINGTEVKNYLNKVIQYEQVQASTTQTGIDKAWMKNVIFVSGGADSIESISFNQYLNTYKQILADTLYGGYCESFSKSSTSAVQQASGDRIEQLINQGVGIIDYFGHSSANTLAFNLSDPAVYTNQGKYPFFNISGCSAGNYYIFDPNRLNNVLTISEKYVLADQRGSIAFLGDTHLGIPPFLDMYNTQLYTAISKTMYGNTLGNQIKRVLEVLGSNPTTLDFYTRMHLEEINLNGDPAIRVNYFGLPDYDIEDQNVKISPSIISVADNSFKVDIKMLNLGKATNDSIRVIVKRKLPNDSIQVLYNQVRPGIHNSDSLSFTVPINPIQDKGLNHIIISLDADHQVNELSESNNDLVKDFYIFEDELRPVYPYNYSIINNQNITYTASTANPVSGNRQYQMEIDTTALFNSPFKKQYTANGPGGIVQFTPTNITFTDSTVYYWRTTITPLTSAPPVWNTFSFIYLSTGGPGYNMSHYYQHINSSYSNTISLDPDRKFRFKTSPHTLTFHTGLYPTTTYDNINVNLDFDQLQQFGCYYGVLQFLVYDSVTLLPWANYNVGSTGRFGSMPVCTTNPESNMFEFTYNGTPAQRKAAMDFMDSIPTGMYVSVTNLGYTGNNTFIGDWQNDQSLYGPGNSIYHKLKSVGFTQIDSFTRNLPFVFFYRKNVSSFTPVQQMGTSADQQMTQTIPIDLKYRSGVISSPLLGPARAWNTLHWRTKSLDVNPAADTSMVQVYGVKNDGTETLLATVSPARDSSLSFINAGIYPNLRLKMLNSDETFATPEQLTYWRINADFLPEGAVAPNILLRMKDTLDQGEQLDFALAFKNISSIPFSDSMTFKLQVTDNQNNTHIIPITKKKILGAGDTLVVSSVIDTRNLGGANTLNLTVNPGFAQPEQTLFNNVFFKNFSVNQDKYHPLLDVTFDGVHILNRDIVSSKPHIVVKLKDENKFMALADTSLMTVQVKFPDHDNVQGELRTYHFGDSMRFTPANLATGDNTATIDFLPFFPDDGEYQFLVTGKDVVGNTAGNIEYKVTFDVINTPMISDMLNYPNPFTTSTAFVFTVTGSEVPQNIRIQILTITGKIVREITKDELGPIHIGRNITEFKWDGTDQYGAKLANGVYLYRVITNLNGKSLDKYNIDEIDNDSKHHYFRKGYGKMYLMR